MAGGRPAVPPRGQRRVCQEHGHQAAPEDDARPRRRAVRPHRRLVTLGQIYPEAGGDTRQGRADRGRAARDVRSAGLLRDDHPGQLRQRGLAVPRHRRDGRQGHRQEQLQDAQQRRQLRQGRLLRGGGPEERPLREEGRRGLGPGACRQQGHSALPGRLGQHQGGGGNRQPGGEVGAGPARRLGPGQDGLQGVPGLRRRADLPRVHHVVQISGARRAGAAGPGAAEHDRAMASRQPRSPCAAARGAAARARAALGLRLQGTGPGSSLSWRRAAHCTLLTPRPATPREPPTEASTAGSPLRGGPARERRPSFFALACAPRASLGVLAEAMASPARGPHFNTFPPTGLCAEALLVPRGHLQPVVLQPRISLRRYSLHH
mmetsp:Transcript_56325/g.146414  ORF Transcript_56325/g.146414 Transcript_56325/m.146414 type:complete len:376 (-) Transcript_56325:187-1314(-)